jgi:uncharacterized small protein (DUF1192 family)
MSSNELEKRIKEIENEIIRLEKEREKWIYVDVKWK